MSNCKDCPSYETNPDVIDAAWTKNPAAAVCLRHGHVLSREGMDEQAAEDLLITAAEDCEDFGKARESNLVAWATTSPIFQEDDTLPAEGGVATCSSCEYCVKTETMFESYEYTLPACKVYGTLIVSNTKAAQTCTRSKPGIPQSSETFVTLDIYKRKYRRPIAAGAVAAAAYTAAYGADVEPSEYKSDATVSAADKRAGIRAWRSIKDDEGHEVFLPIFNQSKFSAEDKALIPKTGDAEHPELYLDYSGLIFKLAVESVMLGETPVLVGQPGLGKTEVTRHLAWLMGAPFRRISMNSKMDPEDLLGSLQYTEGTGTHFVAGVLPIAWESVGVLNIDEPNAAPPEVWQVLRPAFDNSSQLVIEAAPGRPRFTKNRFCYPVLAMNPPWDTRNSGIEDLAMADANRLTSIEVAAPPPTVEMEIIKHAVKALDGWDLDDTTAQALVSIGADLRRACVDDQTFPDYWGTRQQIKVARKLKHYSVEEAFNLASLNFYEPDIRELALRLVRTHIG